MKYEAILKYCEFLFEITDKSTRMRLLLSVLMLGSTTAMGSLSPIFLKKIVDFLTVHRGPTTLLIIYVFLYLAANFFVTAGGEIRWSFYGIAEERIKANVSKLFFKRIFSLPHHFFSNQNQAAVSQVMNVAVQANRGIMINTLLSLFPAAIEFIFACCV
ncbi:MAG: ABC transporter transmembrane domain-containing protein, partial [Janthinobacterium lividum]